MESCLECRVSCHLLKELLPCDLLQGGISSQQHGQMEVIIALRGMTGQQLVLCNGQWDIPLVGLHLLQGECNFKGFWNASLS